MLGSNCLIHDKKRCYEWILEQIAVEIYNRVRVRRSAILSTMLIV